MTRSAKPKLRWTTVLHFEPDGTMHDSRRVAMTVEEKKRLNWGTTQYTIAADGTEYETTYSPLRGWQAWRTRDGITTLLGSASADIPPHRGAGQMYNLAKDDWHYA